MVAAVSDFTPAIVHDHKSKDKSNDQIKLNRTIDILAWLGKHKQNHQV